MKNDFENIFKKIKHEDKDIGKVMNKTMSQALLMSFFHHKIVRK